jgi:hypothetical protein
VATRSTTFGTLTSSSACAASTYNQAGAGIIGYYKLTANTTGTTTTENAASLTTVPVNGSRLIKITGTGTMRATAASGLQVQILEDGAALSRLNFYTTASSLDAAFHIEALSNAPSAGNHSYTLVDGVSGGGGATVNVIASATTPCYLIVEDMGASF